MKAAIFLLGSACLIYVSRTSLQNPRSHGFYRYFAWECILALFLLNVKHWFIDPFSWHQLVAWILLFTSLLPFGFGVRSLTTRGRPTASRKGDAALLAFEKTTKLVTTGIYRHIRHPLYSSLLLLAWGIFFKFPSLAGISVTAVATTFLFATAKMDEAECHEFFGDEYQDYVKHTKMFIPYIF